jgi:hypothetical protein
VKRIFDVEMPADQSMVRVGEKITEIDALLGPAEAFEFHEAG